jgi:hypothetical protein
LWSQILVAVKRYGNNKFVSTFLQYKSLGVPSPHAKLSRGTMWGWFTNNGVLKEYYIRAMKHGTSMENSKQNMPKLEEHPKLKDEMVHILQKMRNVGQPLSTGMMQSITHELIRPKRGGFTITREWFRQFMKQYMCWTYCVANTITSKFPPNWLAQGYTMTCRVLYLVKAYSIPPTLVVNSDQTEVHLVHDGGEKT